MLYDGLPAETKYNFEMYLYNYRELIKSMESKKTDADGFFIFNTIVTGAHPGELNNNDKAWIKSVAMEFRKLMDKSSSAGYSSTKSSLFKLSRYEPDETQLKVDDLLQRLKIVEKTYWDRVVMPTDYNNIPLTAHRIINITHNQYLFHDGTSKAPRAKKQGDDSDFRKDYPKTNPLIINYLGVISGRFAPLGILALFIEQLQNNKLLELELKDDIRIDEFLDLKITLLAL